MLEQKISDLTAAVLRLCEVLTQNAAVNAPNLQNTGVLGAGACICPSKPENAEKGHLNANTDAPAQSAPAQSAPAVPTLDDARRACVEAAKLGYTAEISAFLGAHGVKKLNELPPEHYAALIAHLENSTTPH